MDATTGEASRTTMEDGGEVVVKEVERNAGI